VNTTISIQKIILRTKEWILMMAKVIINKILNFQIVLGKPECHQKYQIRFELGQVRILNVVRLLWEEIIWCHKITHVVCG